MVVNLSLVSLGGGNKDRMEEFYLLVYGPLEKWLGGGVAVGGQEGCGKI